VSDRDEGAAAGSARDGEPEQVVEAETPTEIVTELTSGGEGVPEGVEPEAEQQQYEPFERVRQILAGEPTLSLGEVAQRAGLPVQILREVFDATEWSRQQAYDERDVEYAEAMARMLDYFPLDSLVRSLRTRYRSMSSIVISDLGTVRDRVVMPALASGGKLDEISAAIGGAAEDLLPLITNQLREDYRHVLLRLLDSEAVARGVSPEGGREIELAVGFVDVVGFTKLSGYIDPGELEHVLSGFEDLVSAAVSRTDDTLLAKFIGDAAMIVAAEPVALTAVLVEIVENRQRLAEAPRRGGVAYGKVLVREGDYYGPVPNLAARLTDHANPWSLLADDALGERLEGSFDLEQTSKVKLHGIGDRKPLRVRPLGRDD
jgi:adenylate cyclase